MLWFALFAAAQSVQPVRISPPPKIIPVPSVEGSPSPVQAMLPDLIVPSVRLVGETVAEFEIRNQGRGSAGGPIGVSACAYVGIDSGGVAGAIYCSRIKSIGSIGPGQSRTVQIDCFLDKGRVGLSNPLGSSSATMGPSCANLLELGAWKLDRLTARVDSMAEADTAQSGIAAVRTLARDCAPEFGCVRETNEGNNEASFERPFPG